MLSFDVLRQASGPPLPHRPLGDVFDGIA